jgi:hypothetical protein
LKELCADGEIVTAGVAGPFSVCSDASHWLASGTPHGALLDMLLTDDTCFNLARDLRARGVPYLLHSSSGQPDGGRSSARVEPVPSFNALLKAMSELNRHSANGAGE